MKELQEGTSFSQEVDAWMNDGYSYSHPPIHVIIEDGFLLYANREKAAQFLLSAGVQFPMEEQTNSFLTYKIKDEKDLVKFKQEKEEEKKMA